MFPLNWNIPFIRKNGSRTTLGAITGDIAGIEEDVAGIKEDVNDLTEIADGLFDNMVDNGVVNLLPNYGSTQTISPVTFTVNADKTVTASASEATSSVCNFNITWASKNYKLKPGTYKLTGCPEGGKVPSGSNDTFAIECYNQTASSRIGWEAGDGLEFTLTAESVINIIISIRNGYNIDGSIVFKPMISDPSFNLSYEDYVPYAKTNRDLTEDVADLVAVTSRNGSVFDIAISGGYGGSDNARALVLGVNHIGLLTYSSDMWNYVGLVAANGITITESNKTANGLRLTFSTSTTVNIIPLNVGASNFTVTYVS